MKIRWLNLTVLVMACSMINASNLVICAQSAGVTRIQFAHHECHDIPADVCNPESHLCCSEDCHFHAAECCRDIPLELIPTLVHSGSVIDPAAVMRIATAAILDLRPPVSEHFDSSISSFNPVLSSTILLI